MRKLKTSALLQSEIQSLPLNIPEFTSVRLIRLGLSPMTTPVGVGADLIVATIRNFHKGQTYFFRRFALRN